jgi:peroxiredoxin
MSGQASNTPQLHPDEPGSVVPPHVLGPKPNRINPIVLVFLIFPIIAFIAAFSVAVARPTVSLDPPAIAVTSDTLIGRPAPDFTLTDLSGAKVHLADLRGKVTFLNFWATYCAPCRVEMPVFQALLDGRILGSAHVLTVNRGDSIDQIQGFFKEIAVNLPTALDNDGTVADQYRIVNLPVTYILDKQGVIVDRHIGIMTADDIVAYLAKLDKPQS